MNKKSKNRLKLQNRKHLMILSSWEGMFAIGLRASKMSSK
jgi:hypothetical protein